jgi:hypothetical protein
VREMLGRAVGRRLEYRDGPRTIVPTRRRP